MNRAVPALVACCFAWTAPAAVRQQEGRAIYLVDDKPFFVDSATFAYYDYPKDLWVARLVRLKSMGFNTVQVPRPSGSGVDLPEVLRLARQLGLRVWLEGHATAPELQPFWSSRGGPILEDLAGIHAPWFPALDGASASRRLLHAADLASLQQLIRKQSARGRFPPLVSAFDAGWSAVEEGPLRPSDPSNYLLATRELLAAGAKALNCSAVAETSRSSGAKAAQVGQISGDASVRLIGISRACRAGRLRLRSRRRRRVRGSVTANTPATGRSSL